MDAQLLQQALQTQELQLQELYEERLKNQELKDKVAEFDQCKSIMEDNNAEFMQLSHELQTWVPKHSTGLKLRERLFRMLRPAVPKLSKQDAQIQVQLQKLLEELKGDFEHCKKGDELLAKAEAEKAQQLQEIQQLEREQEALTQRHQEHLQQLDQEQARLQQLSQRVHNLQNVQSPQNLQNLQNVPSQPPDASRISQAASALQPQGQQPLQAP